MARGIDSLYSSKKSKQAIQVNHSMQQVTPITLRDFCYSVLGCFTCKCIWGA